jgi:hypothetical protein
MLDLAAVRNNDFVMDLGSGDGRIVLTAATRHRASGMGVDIDQELVDRANASARRLGVADRVQFLKQDVQVADIKRATVLTLYLLPGMMSTLRPKFLKELRPGTRIVSHDFDLGEWKPDRTVEVETPEKYDLAGSWTSNVHLWVVPAPVHGAGQGTPPRATAELPAGVQPGVRIEADAQWQVRGPQGRADRWRPRAPSGNAWGNERRPP